MILFWRTGGLDWNLGGLEFWFYLFRFEICFARTRWIYIWCAPPFFTFLLAWFFFLIYFLKNLYIILIFIYTYKYFYLTIINLLYGFAYI